MGESSPHTGLMKRFALNTASVALGLLVFTGATASFKTLTADGGPVANLMWDISMHFSD